MREKSHITIRGKPIRITAGFLSLLLSHGVLTSAADGSLHFQTSANRDCLPFIGYVRDIARFLKQLDYFVLLIEEEKGGDVFPPLSKWVWRR